MLTSLLVPFRALLWIFLINIILELCTLCKRIHNQAIFTLQDDSLYVWISHSDWTNNCVPENTILQCSRFSYCSQFTKFCSCARGGFSKCSTIPHVCDNSQRFSRSRKLKGELKEEENRADFWAYNLITVIQTELFLKEEAPLFVPRERLLKIDIKSRIRGF